MSYLTTPLNASFIKGGFSCGKSLLDDYLHKQASQDVKRKLCVVFVLPDDANGIKGYYTLSNNSIPQKNMPTEIIKKMPASYTDLPATLLGRLAVDKNYRKQGIGELLLLDALKRSYDISINSLGSIAVVVDPLDEEAKKFYKKYGFIELPDSGKMFLSMSTIGKIFK
jgi:GNAT superfamily N-acetyltransferase